MNAHQILPTAHRNVFKPAIVWFGINAFVSSNNFDTESGLLTAGVDRNGNSHPGFPEKNHHRVTAQVITCEGLGVAGCFCGCCKSFSSSASESSTQSTLPRCGHSLLIGGGG